MAGKSTVLRSTVAVALLAACGFYAPVASAAVPYTDAFMLRTFSADAPLEGRSSFAVEMVEMRCARALAAWSCDLRRNNILQLSPACKDALQCTSHDLHL